MFQQAVNGGLGVNSALMLARPSNSEGQSFPCGSNTRAAESKDKLQDFELKLTSCRLVVWLDGSGRIFSTQSWSCGLDV